MFEFGQIVKVKSFPNQVLERRVVSVIKNTVCLCNEQEFQLAIKEKREPVSIGFPLYDVIQEA